MLVIDGRKVPVPGVMSRCFLDDPKLGFNDPKDFKTRVTTPTIVCLHTRLGIYPQKIVPGSANKTWDELVGERMTDDDRHASWHISIDADGSFVCHLDLKKIWAYHAEQINEVSIGIEMYQDTDGTIYQATIDACVKILDVITRELGIQRQFPVEDAISVRFARSNPGVKKSQTLAYLKGGLEGKNYVGITGHRNCTRNRGKGDPGYKVFEALEQAGYEKFSVDKQEDLETWKKRQKALGMSDNICTGVPETQTRNLLTANGHKFGLWVIRPGD